MFSYSEYQFHFAAKASRQALKKLHIWEEQD